MSDNEYRHDWDWVSRALRAEQKAKNLQNATIAVALLSFLIGLVVGHVVF